MTLYNFDFFLPKVVPLFFLSEQRGTTGTRKRICPYDVVIITTPIQA